MALRIKAGGVTSVVDKKAPATTRPTTAAAKTDTQEAKPRPQTVAPKEETKKAPITSTTTTAASKDSTKKPAAKDTKEGSAAGAKGADEADPIEKSLNERVKQGGSQTAVVGAPASDSKKTA